VAVALVLEPAAAIATTATAIVAIAPAADPDALPALAPPDAPPACAITLPASIAKKIVATSLFVIIKPPENRTQDDRRKA
jgi:hypothetical protein